MVLSAYITTHFTTWAEHTWGIRTLVDMESMLSYHFYHIGDKRTGTGRIWQWHMSG